jgi:hypothetical protein
MDYVRFLSTLHDACVFQCMSPPCALTRKNNDVCLCWYPGIFPADQYIAQVIISHLNHNSLPLFPCTNWGLCKSLCAQMSGHWASVQCLKVLTGFGSRLSLLPFCCPTGAVTQSDCLRNFIFEHALHSRGILCRGQPYTSNSV